MAFSMEKCPRPSLKLNHMDMGMFSFKIFGGFAHVPDSGFRNKSVKDNEKEPLSNFRDKIL